MHEIMLNTCPDAATKVEVHSEGESSWLTPQETPRYPSAERPLTQYQQYKDVSGELGTLRNCRFPIEYCSKPRTKGGSC